MKKSDKKKKVLILASVASMIGQFNMQNIQLLLEHGYKVDVACNCREGNTVSDEQVKRLVEMLLQRNVDVIHVPIPRKITDIRGIMLSLQKVKKMCNDGQYILLHCHSPIGSVVARIAARKSRKRNVTKVMYTAHGFHFYKGAPIKNWLIFYPIEKICARFTDVLITINKEDYEFAKTHMNIKRIEYIPGIGVDTKKFKVGNLHKRELGIDNDDIMLLSVGEVNQNKNHEVVIRAIAKLKNPSIHYFIAGQGVKEEYLKQLADELGVSLHLLGYRTDIVKILNTADVFVFPSFREGLSVALMEAMAAGLPCVVSEIRGNVDLIDKNGGYLCDPYKPESFAKSIDILVQNRIQRIEMGRYNQEAIENFDVYKVNEKMKEIYFE